MPVGTRVIPSLDAGSVGWKSGDAIDARVGSVPGMQIGERGIWIPIFQNDGLSEGHDAGAGKDEYADDEGSHVWSSTKERSGDDQGQFLAWATHDASHSTSQQNTSISQTKEQHDGSSQPGVPLSSWHDPEAGSPHPGKHPSIGV